ncbi:Subtilisin-like protease SBT5.4 [Striga hermonthica]|uniref:Subtilisin-like protease SBT5.4 n=1 Tax=Striga hermonthica TaxID=68872 RepID=A0A9N7MPD2_STRHE|nr:Subtilisin-like protease SBT5.4 [Striga hermonthica]
MPFPRFSNFLALLILFVLFQRQALAIKKSYVVYLGEHNHGPDVTTADYQRVKDSHIELLTSFLGSEQKAKDSIFYSYKRNINGFAAVLEEDEAAQIAKHPGVLSVLLNKALKLHTTHSWDFLELENDGLVRPSSLWEKARYGEDTIIATVDTGIWPESKSFNDDDGFGPIPSKWKGICQFENHKHLCNRKLIGARYFNKGYEADLGKPLNSSFQHARDLEGHGTHTLSTAAGGFVPWANVFGAANGTSKGGSPRARAAAYKVCWDVGDDNVCLMADIMKAIDVAIDDGVDVLSLSLGGFAASYFEDGLAIATFHAVRRGVVVVASAGNDGPFPGYVSNVAPWIITVGASTIDREFHADVVLRDGRVFKGASRSKPLPEKKFYPLISSVQARAPNASKADAILCKPNSLDPKKSRGKIVVCHRGENPRLEKGLVAARAGAVGMILANDEMDGAEILADPHLLPATHINYTDGRALFAYVNSTKNPEGLIRLPNVLLKKKPAPVMADFSSRGPNSVTPEILKPDVTAPGVNIIASFSEAANPTDMDFDHRKTPFNILSGTSMACPHVSGVAGLLRSLHPDWSPAAIRSAIMTTARTRDNTGKPLQDWNQTKATPLMYGSGHIRPNRAHDPGLVYDLTVNDYLDFLCGSGYNQTLLAHFTTSHYDCPTNYSVLDFNNPSIMVPQVNSSATVTRRVKNVGPPGKYTSRVRQPPGFMVSVEPKVLEFKEVGEEKAFKVTLKAKRGVKSDYYYGELLWSDGRHYVRSPIVADLNYLNN